ncbi:hypothetical protein PGTUg99_002451 [Puccinia graminis f. sp. tritici]|uniref:Uncharacterized protein n=1 Tax=Puccinia graminis f. sp. tritici TaxID=56615 RepID=A0A5B0RVE1_PUCGR|nr:hypothetical protein PGTUg99_002451 [Puccinia graminis f. sp. tritici]
MTVSVDSDIPFSLLSSLLLSNPNFNRSLFVSTFNVPLPPRIHSRLLIPSVATEEGWEMSGCRCPMKIRSVCIIGTYTWMLEFQNFKNSIKMFILIRVGRGACIPGSPTYEGSSLSSEDFQVMSWLRNRVFFSFGIIASFPRLGDPGSLLFLEVSLAAKLHFQDDMFVFFLFFGLASFPSCGPPICTILSPSSGKVHDLILGGSVKSFVDPNA